MALDNPYQSPDPESPAKQRQVSESRRNWMDYSTEYNPAFKAAFLLQAVLAVVTALLLDFGQNASCLLGRVPLPMCDSLDDPVSTGNAPNKVCPGNRTLWDRSTTVRCRVGRALVPASARRANLRRDEQGREPGRPTTRVLKSTSIAASRLRRSLCGNSIILEASLFPFVFSTACSVILQSRHDITRTGEAVSQ